LDANPEELFLIIIGLLLLKIDISHLLIGHNSAFIKSEFGKHIFDLMSRYYAGEPIVKKTNYESEIIGIGVDLLQELQVDKSCPNSEIQEPSMSAFMTLMRLAKILPKLQFPYFRLTGLLIALLMLVIICHIFRFKINRREFVINSPSIS
jgi:hypothetical protein